MNCFRIFLKSEILQRVEDKYIILSTNLYHFIELSKLLLIINIPNVTILCVVIQHWSILSFPVALFSTSVRKIKIACVNGQFPFIKENKQKDYGDGR